MGCCAPCFKFHAYVKDARAQPEKKDDPAAILILENALTTTVDLITENMSWATAGILSIAFQLTILLTEWHDLAETWIYFAILLIIAIFYGTCPQTVLVDDWQVVGMNLKKQMNTHKENDLTIAQYLKLQEEDVVVADRDIVKKRISGTLSKQLKNENANANDNESESERKEDKNETKDANKEDRSQLGRLAKLTHIEVNVLFRNMNSLAIATLANVLALTLNYAVIQTVTDNVSGEASQALVFWLCAIFQTLFNLLITLRLAILLVNKEKETYQYIIENGIENSKSTIIAFQSYRRGIKLLCYIFGLAMAWAWEDAIKWSIYAMFTDHQLAETILILWVYIVIVQFLVTLFNTFSRGALGLSKSHFGRYFNFDNIKNRSYKNKKWLLYAVFYKNLQVVVGLAWYDAIVSTASAIAGTSKPTLLLILWLFIIILIFVSVICQYYWKKYWFGYEILRKGILKAYYESNADVTGDTDELDKDIKEAPSGNYGSVESTGANDNDTATAAPVKVTVESGLETETTAMLELDHNKVKIESGASQVELSKREAFWLVFWKEFVDLLIYAWSVGGSYSVYAALTYTFIAIFYKKGTLFTDGSTFFLSSEVDVTVSVVIACWIAWIISLFFAVLLLTYLSTLIKAATKKRKDLFKRQKGKYNIAD